MDKQHNTRQTNERIGKTLNVDALLVHQDIQRTDDDVISIKPPGHPPD